MQFLKALFALLIAAALGSPAAMAQMRFGPEGAEGEPNRMQQWLVPSPEPGIAAHALLFRPSGEGSFPLALIAHASTQNVVRRAQMPQPEYRAMAAWLVMRGFAVLVPERLGHGATGGKYVEDQGGCDEADYSRAGRATAPAFSRQLADAFRTGGDKVDLHVLPASGSEGHWLAETEAGVKIAGSVLERALMLLHPTVVKKR